MENFRPEGVDGDVGVFFNFRMSINLLLTISVNSTSPILLLPSTMDLTSVIISSVASMPMSVDRRRSFRFRRVESRVVGVRLEKREVKLEPIIED